MSLAYPLARSAEDALKGVEDAARTRYEAEELAGETPILSLETEWLKPATNEIEALLKQALSGEANGFIQTYEDADGKPVLAVTYWKLGAEVKPSKARPKSTPPEPDTPPEEAKAPRKKTPSEDYTDDLYFRHGRTRRSRARGKQPDPRQMDLFARPDQRGYEHTDPNNPKTMLTDEEGDGTVFGGQSDAVED